MPLETIKDELKNKISMPDIDTSGFKRDLSGAFRDSASSTRPIFRQMIIFMKEFFRSLK